MNNLFIYFELLVFKNTLTTSGQGEHLCIVKILEILKIKFRKITKVPILKPDLIRAVS